MSIISNIDHIAIVVKSIEEVKPFYEQTLGLSISYIEELPQRGIKTAFIQIGNTTLELIESTHENSEVSSFLQKRGPGIHHIALKTNNLENLSQQITNNQAKLIYDAPKKGAHNKSINFIHPKNSYGVLFEIVQEEKFNNSCSSNGLENKKP